MLTKEQYENLVKMKNGSKCEDILCSECAFRKPISKGEVNALPYVWSSRSKEWIRCTLNAQNTQESIKDKLNEYYIETILLGEQ